MSYRVLVVDDEPRITETLALVLRHNGYETAVAHDGSSALAKCSEFLPDLLLTDVVMPGMDGIELSRRVTERIPTCKVLLFSGHGATADMLERARAHGQNLELLSKPVHPAVLLSKIAQILQSSAVGQIA